MIGSDEIFDQSQPISAPIKSYEYGNLHPQVFLFNDVMTSAVPLSYRFN
jgi:hypothetical protein